MFLLHGLHFVLCSLELDVLCAQRIIWLFYLNCTQINELVRKSYHMVVVESIVLTIMLSLFFFQFHTPFSFRSYRLK